MSEPSKPIIISYRPTVKECREYYKCDSFLSITPNFVFIDGGVGECSVTHRVFKKMIADYQKRVKS